MNWKEISEKHPKAYALLLNFVTFNIFEYTSVTCDEQYLFFFDEDSYIDHAYHFNNRDLYDFFDEQGITIYIVPCNDYGWKLSTNAFKSIVDYTDDNKTVRALMPLSEINEERVFIIRTKAETEAFKTAFQILEKQLEGE